MLRAAWSSTRGPSPNCSSVGWVYARAGRWGCARSLEEGGKTTVTVTVLYESQEARDAVLESGMAQGVAESYDKLAELLPSIA